MNTAPARLSFVLLVAAVCGTGAVLAEQAGQRPAGGLPPEPGSTDRPVPREMLVTAHEEVSVATIIAVSDGDSVQARENGSSISLHLDGVDAPELSQKFGAEARTYLSELVINRGVTVRVRSRATRGRESRARVEVGGVDVSLLLLRRGLARYCSLHNEDPRLREAEAEARKARRGLWDDPDQPAPWKHRGVKECWQDG